MKRKWLSSPLKIAPALEPTGPAFIYATFDWRTGDPEPALYSCFCRVKALPLLKILLALLTFVSSLFKVCIESNTRQELYFRIRRGVVGQVARPLADAILASARDLGNISFQL